MKLMKIEEEEHIELYEGLDRKYAVSLKKLVTEYKPIATKEAPLEMVIHSIMKHP